MKTHRLTLLLVSAALVTAGCGGPDEGAALDGVTDPEEEAVIEDGQELVAVLEADDDRPVAMTGDYIIDKDIALSEDVAYPWYELLDGGPDYRFCVLNTVSLAWAEFDSTQGGLVDSGADGGNRIGAVCGE